MEELNFKFRFYLEGLRGAKILRSGKSLILHNRVLGGLKFEAGGNFFWAKILEILRWRVKEG